MGVRKRTWTNSNGTKGKAWVASYTDPKGKPHRPHFRTRAQAEAHLAEMSHDKRRGAYVDPRDGRITVEAWAESWLATKAAIKPTTLDSYRSLLRSRVLSEWGSMALADLTHIGIAGWVAAMNRDLGPSRVRKAHGVLAQMLDAAVRSQRIKVNPARGVELPRVRRHEMQVLAMEQVHALADACERDEDRLLVLTLGLGGLRYGEAVALRVRRLDRLGRRLNVVEAFAEIAGEGLVVTTPKTHQHRYVAIPSWLAQQLDALVEGRGPDDLIFTAPEGGPNRYRNWRRRAFDPAAERVHLVGVTPHTLRHTCASLLHAAGASVAEVQRQLGHESPAVTLTVYTHLFGHSMDGVADRLEGLAPSTTAPANEHKMSTKEIAHLDRHRRAAR